MRTQSSLSSPFSVGMKLLFTPWTVLIVGNNLFTPGICKTMKTSSIRHLFGLGGWVGGSPPILSLFGFSEMSDNCRPPLRGTRFLIFEWWFLVKNLKVMNHLKTITMVSMETKFVSQDSILDKLSEKFYLSRFWEGNRVFTRGGGTLCPPPLCPPELQKSLPWIGLTLYHLPSQKSTVYGRWKQKTSLTANY